MSLARDGAGVVPYALVTKSRQRRPTTCVVIARCVTVPCSPNRPCPQKHLPLFFLQIDHQTAVQPGSGHTTSPKLDDTRENEREPSLDGDHRQPGATWLAHSGARRRPNTRAHRVSVARRFARVRHRMRAFLLARATHALGQPTRSRSWTAHLATSSSCLGATVNALRAPSTRSFLR